MGALSFLARVGVAGLVVLAVLSSVTAAQTPDSVVPVISARTYTSGSVKVTVTGSFQVDQEVAINTAASISDGEMTWLQFGASGSASGDVLVTYGENIGEGVGIMVGKGKPTATAGTELCDGVVDVAPTLISGHYTCTGVTSYDSSTGRMGKVDIRITFTAKS